MGGPRFDAALRLSLDAPEGGPDGGLLCCRDPVGPPLARDAEVGAELAGILKPGAAKDLHLATANLVAQLPP